MTAVQDHHSRSRGVLLLSRPHYRALRVIPTQVVNAKLGYPRSPRKFLWGN
jgi:hypothetical protein